MHKLTELLVAMKRLQVKDISASLLAEAWKLYESSFPTEERRNWNQQQAIMQLEAYHFDLVMYNHELVGILLWWEFATIRYIEHFAIQTSQRNSGFGKTCLENFIAESDVQVLLEVEKPEDSLKQRRIGFYQRLGFHLNAYDYAHPPYLEGGDFVELLLMSYPDKLREDELQTFKTKGHPVIHRPYFEKNPG